MGADERGEQVLPREGEHAIGVDGDKRICSPLTRLTVSRTPLGVSKSVLLILRAPRGTAAPYTFYTFYTFYTANHPRSVSEGIGFIGVSVLPSTALK